MLVRIGFATTRCLEIPAAGRAYIDLAQGEFFADLREPASAIVWKVEMKRIGTSIPILILGFSTCCAAAEERDPLRARGEEIARTLCAPCHAIGITGSSPHVGAPVFRNLDERLDLDTFVIRLRKGLTSGHPDMPTFRFSRNDARALVAYLLSVQQ